MGRYFCTRTSVIRSSISFGLLSDIHTTILSLGSGVLYCFIQKTEVDTTVSLELELKTIQYIFTGNKVLRTLQCAMRNLLF
jgi:hypothetical protein